jgi:hypothetical protein
LIFFFLKLFTSISIFSQSINELNLAKFCNEHNINSSSGKFELMVKKSFTVHSHKSKIDLVLRNAGVGLTMAGASMIVGGIVILATDFPYYKDSNSQSSSSYKTLGVGLVLFGGLFASGGIAMTIIGQRKINATKLRTSFSISPNLVSFACHF